MRFYQNLPLRFLIACICLFSYACKDKKAEIERSYYYWQNKSYLAEDEKNFLKKNRITKLYTKILDVDWSDVYGPIPVSENHLNEITTSANIYDLAHLNIVPVIFINNKTFQKIDTSQLHIIAVRILERCMIDKNVEDHGYMYSVKKPVSSEIQFDCNWTERTAGSYFQFLREVKKLLPDSMTVSATVRLHQYKYFSKTGVPPVDRGMLMLYNIDDQKKYDAANSIFDYDKANAYFTTNTKYPLPLDVVLPAFSWSLVFRNHQFYQVENDLSEHDLSQLGFLQKQNNGLYRVKADTVFHDLFLRTGDEIKPEEVSVENLSKAVELAKKAVNSKKYAVAFFDLSKYEVKKYNGNEIDKLYNSF